MSSIRVAKSKNILGFVLVLCLLLLSPAPSAYGVSWPWHHQRHHHSKATGALVGGAIGATGGALIGGGKGALIGGAAGAGTGALVQHARNVHRRHHYYRRYPQ
jgi:uncharacterized membrane protein